MVLTCSQLRIYRIALHVVQMLYHIFGTSLADS